jgi:6-pyruvoyltetrahydropterin/6-carboxytetrahydropterin synthase
MPLVYLTRIEHFNASHRLFCAGWTDAQNEAVFGKCANKNGHGHNFVIEVTVKGKPDPETGFVVDLKKLKQVIHSYIINPLDHKNLNLDVPFLKDIQPSIENIAAVLWEQLLPHLPAEVKLHKITLHETERNSCEYTGA